MLLACRTLCCCLLLWLGARAPATAQTVTEAALEQEFQQKVLPLIQSHCLDCHDTATQEAKLDLSLYQHARQVTDAHRVWEIVLERVEAGEMPPEDASEKLSDAQRTSMVAWIHKTRRFEAERHAGDPGAVLARRLSNAEYDYTIRDLCGVDIRPTQTFPVDPANEEGFDNSGESLSMSPALMNKYLDAARSVVDHMVFTPDGIRFAPHPVMTDTDRDKYCVKRIVEFYLSQPTDFADYFFAAWSYRYRQALGQPDVTLTQVAEQQGLSPKYLTQVWDGLQLTDIAHGPLAVVQQRWRELPAPEQPTAAREGCVLLRDYVLQSRKLFEPRFDNLDVEGIHHGAQAFVLWKNKQYANHRRSADFSFLKALAADEAAASEPSGSQAKREKQRQSSEDEGAAQKIAEAQQLGIELPTPEQRDAWEADCATFCALFPDAFFISERGRDYLGTPRAEQEKGRLLSAGFHSMMGYFRDDQPLVELILDERGRQRLDALWQELDFFTAAPMRQYQGFLWFERTDSRFMRDPEFDFARPEDKAALTEPLVRQLSEVYIAKAVSAGATAVPLQAIGDYFDEINRQMRWVEAAWRKAEPHHLQAALELAERGFRRPLTASEQEDLRGFYNNLREVHGLSHEEALQDTVVTILMSPRFCYRVDLLSDSPAARPLDDFELASRLSYFLWSSMPDDELRQLAAEGRLHQPDILWQQTQRMLADPRVRGLAIEFGGNWLDFRRFEEHNSVDRERFPSFDDSLRAAMFEEPIRFFLDLIQHDRPATDFLNSSRTFVNAPLAKHYGMNELEIADGKWVEVTDASRFGRGGLLPMAVFMTKNAPGLRTSPVKRGYWVVRRLLGERIPPPPPNVPELPSDESQLGELTLRETLAKHRDHVSCAGCHNRFDAIGLAFEGYGPVGELREVDLGGRPIDAQAVFPDGSSRDGLADLRDYLREQREADFVDNLNRKLLSYALGRTLLLSDELLLESMREAAQSEGAGFSQLIRTIVTSPQFLNKRGSAPSETAG